MKRKFIYYLLTYAIFSSEAYACDDEACVKLKKLFVYNRNVLTLKNREIPESWSTEKEPCRQDFGENLEKKVARLEHMADEQYKHWEHTQTMLPGLDRLYHKCMFESLTNDISESIKEVRGFISYFEKHYEMKDKLKEEDEVLSTAFGMYTVVSLDIARGLVDCMLGGLVKTRREKGFFCGHKKEEKEDIHVLEIGAGKGWWAQAIEESGEDKVTVKATDINGYNPKIEQIGSKKLVEKEDFSAAINKYGEWADVLLLISIQTEQTNDLTKALESWESTKPIIMANHDSGSCISPNDKMFEDTYREITPYTNNWAVSRLGNEPLARLIDCYRGKPLGFLVTYKKLTEC